MSFCLNPDCQRPQNPEGVNFCQTCGTKIEILRNHYKVTGLLSDEGGFGRTYLAEDIDKLNERCVVKQLAPKVEGTWALKKSVELFQEEARKLQKMGVHPQIPTLFAYFEDNNHLYLVQECIEGKTLAQDLQQRGTWNEGQIVNFLGSILPVLRFIHDHSVIHRDIKPANIICRQSDRQFVLIDFGASKQFATTVAARGTMIGSFGYTPIEQMQGGEAYPSSDLYSLGATCFHLLTQVDPYSLFLQNGYSWVRDWQAQLPAPLGHAVSAVLNRLLQEDRYQRYQSAAEVLQDLNQTPIFTDSSIPPTEIAPPLPPSLPNQSVPNQSVPNQSVPNQYQSISHPSFPPQPPPTQPIFGQPQPTLSGPQNFVAPPSPFGQFVPSQAPLPLVQPPSYWTRRKTVKALGLGGGGFIVAVLGYWLFRQQATPQLTVSKLGVGDFESISDAIAHAKPGTRILIKPGRYQEGLTINQPLELIGEGDAADIIIESDASNCITMKADFAVVRGLTLRCQIANADEKYFGVDISQGELMLEGCDITSNSLSNIAIYSASANPTIRHCRIHMGKENGVFIFDNAKGILEDCEIFANEFSGIEIKEGANPIIRRCKVYDGKSSGVYVHLKGQGILEECEMFANTLAGISIETAGNPVLRQCMIRDGKASGVYVYGNGQGIVEASEIFANAFAGVEIKEGGDPVIRQCNIHDGKSSGVYVYSKGKGTIEECDILANGLSGIAIEEEGNLVVRRCNIHQNQSYAISVIQNGRGTVEASNLKVPLTLMKRRNSRAVIILFRSIPPQF